MLLKDTRRGVWGSRCHRRGSCLREGGGTIIISGEIDVLDGDIVRVEMKSSLSPGTKEIEFAGNDRLVLTWE